MLSKVKILGSIVGIAIIGYLQYSLISGSYDAGYTACKEENQKYILELQSQIKDKEKVFNERVEALSIELTETRLRHENTIDTIKRTYADELRKSEQRASVYQRYTTADEAKQRALIKHTTELDRSLTEGRELVRQLTETIKLRDAQLRALGKYIEERHILYEQ